MPTKKKKRSASRRGRPKSRKAAAVHTDNQLWLDVWDAWKPPPKILYREWVPANIRIPSVT